MTRLGRYASCNCTKFRFGGYGREDTALAEIRKNAKDTVLVEGGDFLGLPDVAQDKLKAVTAAKCLGTLGYAAVVPGERDLAFGSDSLRSYQTTAECRSSPRTCPRNRRAGPSSRNRILSRGRRAGAGSLS